MLHPHPAYFLMAVASLGLQIYYLIKKKEDRKQWPSVAHLVFYFGMALAVTIIAWEMVYVILIKLWK